MISVLCPTRGREENCRRLVKSAIDTRQGVSVEIIFRTDDDAPLQGDWPAGVVEVRGPRITLSQMWNECFEKAKYDIVMQCGDDIVFRTPGWPARVVAEFSQIPDKIALVYGNDLLQGQALATHGFVHRRWVEEVGYFTPPHFSCDYGDQWLFDVAGMIDRRRYLPDVVTEHLHPAAGKALWDQNHMERLARGQADRVGELYDRTLPERQRDADILRGLMQ